MWQQRIAHETRHLRRPNRLPRPSQSLPETYLPPSNPNLLRDLPFHHISPTHSIVSGWHARLNFNTQASTTPRCLPPREAGSKAAYKTWDGSSLGRLVIQAPLGLDRSRRFLDASVRRSLEADLGQASSPTLSSPSASHLQELQTLLSLERKVLTTQRRKQLEGTIRRLATQRS